MLGSCLCFLEQATEQKRMLQPGQRYGAAGCVQTSQVLFSLSSAQRVHHTPT